MDIKKLIGLRIKELRKTKNYTQEKLAESVNLDISAISKAEQGISTPSINTFKKIADTLPKDKQAQLYRIAKSFE